MANRKDKVICVKIAQRMLRHPKQRLTYDYFPYDRVYLAREKLAPVFRKTFRYYLSMPLNKELLDALNGLQVNTIKESPILRDDLRRKGAPGKYHDNFKSLVRNHRGWIMIVPTHVKSIYQDPKNFKNPYASRVGYLLSNAIQKGHNDKAVLPRVTFYTPDRTIPVLCAVCKSLPLYHAAKCTPGTSSCKQNIESELSLDSEFYQMSRRSVEEAGGEA